LLAEARRALKSKAIAALGQVIDGRDSKNRHIDDGSAGWATSRSKAASQVLADDPAPRSPVSINVNTAVVTPGYVIRQPARRAPQSASDTTVADVTPNEQKD
jgi:hypothetical protein